MLNILNIILCYCYILYYVLDAQLFLWPQLVPHTKLSQLWKLFPHPQHIPHREHSLSLNLYYNLGKTIILDCGILLTAFHLTVVGNEQQCDIHDLKPQWEHPFLPFHSFDIYSSTQHWHRQEIFLYSKVSRQDLGATQPPIQWVLEVHSLGVKQPGCEADHHLHLVPTLRMMGAIHHPPPSPYAYTACTGGLNILMSGLWLFLYDKLHLPSVPSCSLSSSSFIT